MFGEEAVAHESVVAPASREAVRFKRVDPRGLYLGSQRLEEYLRDAEQEWILRLTEFLLDQDWSAFEAAYHGGGREPYPPARIAGLIIYGYLKGVTSLRELERLARLDVGAMWVACGLAPDYSTLCRFLHRHEALITGSMFEQITAEVLRRVGGSVREVAIDGTTVQAAASRYRKLTAEAARVAAQRARDAADADPADTKRVAEAARAEDVARVAKERAQVRRAAGKDAAKVQVSPTEPDAAVQPLKDKSIAPSYKLSAAVTEQRIIVAHHVHPTSETTAVPLMIEQAMRVGRERVQREMLDAGYFCDMVLQHAVDYDLDVLCPEGNPERSPDWERASTKQFPKSKFHYDAATDSYECPAGKRLLRLYDDKNARRPYTKYRGTECGTCPLRDQCTGSRRGRTIKRYAGDELKDAQRQVMKHPLARSRYMRRQAWVEPAFGSLKDRQRLRRFRRRGLPGVRLEAAMHAIAHNIGRFLVFVAALAAATGATAPILAAVRAFVTLWSTHVGLNRRLPSWAPPTVPAV